MKRTDMGIAQGFGVPVTMDREHSNVPRSHRPNNSVICMAHVTMPEISGGFRCVEDGDPIDICALHGSQQRMVR